MKPRPRLTRPPINIDHNSPSSPSPSSLASTLEYQRKQVYLGAAVAAQQQLQQHLSQQQNTHIKSVQKSIMSHQRNNDRAINNHFINNSNNNNNVLTKHQQLQHLLKSNDNINNNQNRNLNASTRSQFALPCKNINWPQGSIPTSQAPPSMPTSLLNLAACSSSNQTASPNIGSSSSARSRNIIHNRVNSNSNTVLGNMPATRSSSLMNSNNVPRNRNQSSLLQDEVSKSSKLNNTSNLSVIHHTNKPTAKPAQAPPAQVGPKRLSSRSNVKSDLNQSHNLGSQSVTIELVSSSHASDVQQTNTKIDHQEKDLDYLTCTRTADDSVLQPPVSLGNKSRKHVNAYATGMLSDSDQLTNEVKSLVLEECNIIYECKSCSNLFRSLPNFVKHKRSFCHERSMILEEGTKSRSMASLLSVDPSQNLKSDDKISGEQTNDDHDSNLEPNSAVVDFRPLDYENGNIVTHTYNSRGPGKRYNLAHELRMLRLLHNHDRKAQQQKEAARQKERSLIANEAIPVETSLSKLLQSQPKARLPASQDKALIEALTIATATSPPVSSIEQQNSNLDTVPTKESNRITSRRASSILSTKSIISVEQDNIAHKGATIETSGDSIHNQTKQAQGITRKMAPKRKFLEDCIQKVKRDKKLVEEEDQSVNVQLTSIDSNSNAVLQTTSINEQIEHSDSVKERLGASADSELHLKPDSGNSLHLDSDSDDMLTIDLGEIDIIKKKAQPAKSRRRSTNTTNPKVSSSALLKALTRPVLEQKQTIKDISSTSSANDLAKQVISNLTTEDTYSDKGDSLLIDIKMTCDICNIDFVDSQSLVQHNETKHLIEKVVYPCIFCSLSFTLLENACRHIIEIHKKPRTQLHRLKDVVKFRSHLTTDFSACEDYVPSKNPSATSGEELSDRVSIASDELIENAPKKQEKPLSLPKQTKAGGISESIPLDKSETSITESNEATAKEKNIDVVVDDIVNQVVDDHLVVEDQNAIANSSEAEDSNIITTKEFNIKPEVRNEPVALTRLVLSEKDSVIDEQEQNLRIEDQDNEVEDPISHHEQQRGDSSDDSEHCENESKQKPSRTKKLPPETNLVDETPCASAPPSDISTNSEYDSRPFKDDNSSLEKEVKEVLAYDLTDGDYHFTSCEGSKKQQHKIEQEINRTDDKRDNKIITHESSSKKHHSKEEIRHTKSHDKNKSRSRSSSTEHVKSDERSHHKSSSNHHTSSAKKKHQSKAEQKTSPVPSAEPIMKLKIQLKTRPDEKCKVYEIV